MYPTFWVWSCAKACKLVDLEKCVMLQMKIHLQKSASIQPRTSLLNFGCDVPTADKPQSIPLQNDEPRKQGSPTVGPCFKQQDAGRHSTTDHWSPLLQSYKDRRAEKQIRRGTKRLAPMQGAVDGKSLEDWSVTPLCAQLRSAEYIEYANVESSCNAEPHFLFGWSPNSMSGECARKAAETRNPREYPKAGTDTRFSSVINKTTIRPRSSHCCLARISNFSHLCTEYYYTRTRVYGWERK